MSFPAHERYKESGRDWLGMVPDHWRVAPFWSLFRRTKRTGFLDAELLSVYRDYGVIRKADRDDNFNNASEDLSTYQLVEPGDLAMNKMKAWQGSLGVSAYRGIVSPAYFVFQSQHAEDPSFLHYLLRSGGYAVGFMTISKGIRIGQWDLDPDHLGAVPIPLPPLPEQRAIAAFLDRETAKIDALVEGQRRLIDLLKEKRQAVISHAVTKGLNPSAPMKDSGVEWLGQVPAHWEVVPIKRLARLQSGEAITSTDIEATGSFPVYGGNGLRGFSERYTHDGDFVLIGRQGALCGNINYAQGTFWASEHAIVAHPLQAFSTRWFGELLRTMNLGQYSVAAAQPGLSADALGNLRCPCPSMDEQYGIANAIEEALSIFDPLIGEAESAIALLQERRAALISAAVTGKIDVRDVAVLTKEADAA